MRASMQLGGKIYPQGKQDALRTTNLRLDGPCYRLLVEGMRTRAFSSNVDKGTTIAYPTTIRVRNLHFPSTV